MSKHSDYLTSRLKELTQEVKHSFEAHEEMHAIDKRRIAELVRINLDLKQALREQCAAPAMRDPVLIEALVKGVAEEGSITGRVR